MRELCERAVEADGLVRVVVDGGLDQEDADQAEHHTPRKVADRPDPCDPLADGKAHLGGLHRARLVRHVPAGAEGDLDREDADDAVDHAAGDEAGARERLEGGALANLVARALGLLDRRRLAWCVNAHAPENGGTAESVTQAATRTASPALISRRAEIGLEGKAHPESR